MRQEFILHISRYFWPRYHVHLFDLDLHKMRTNQEIRNGVSRALLNVTFLSFDVVVARLEECV